MIAANQVQRSAHPAAEGERKPTMVLPTVRPIEVFASPSSQEPPPKPPLSFMESILTSDKFNKMEIPEDESLVGSWLKMGTRGFIYAQRGMGKTWMSMHLALCLAEGHSCGPWTIPKPRRVLYVDGEMSLKTMQERSLGLTPAGSPNFHLLSYHHHYNVGGADFNLVKGDAQGALLEVCEGLNIEVLFLDNLSCLFRGMREDKAEDWEAVAGWLASFQPRGIATCIVHHAGRDDSHMRGTTKREDNCDWIMGIKAPSSEWESSAKYRTDFVTSFEKYRRGSETDKGPWRWSFETMTDGEPTTVRHKLEGNIEVFIQLVKNGLDSCGDIAAEMSLSKGRVSELAKKAAAKGLISISDRKYLYNTAP